MVHVNPDGSADLGVMQVNTLWVGPLSASARIPPELVRDRLVWDPCFNIAAAAAIFRAYWHESAGDLLRAVGFYHSHTPQLRDAYLAQVLRSARLLFGGR